MLIDLDGRLNQLVQTVTENMNKITSLSNDVTALKGQVTALETNNLIVSATLNAQTEINEDVSATLRTQGKVVRSDGTH